MSSLDTFDHILLSLYDAMLDDALWPATSALIDEACGASGNSLVVGDGFGADVRVFFARFYCRGERRQEHERMYFEDYHPWDERLPRCRQLPDSRLVRNAELYTEEELRTSRTYNEWQRRAGNQNGLYVRLDGPQGSRIVWGFSDPVDGDGWQSDQIAMIKRLLPHVRQYVRVRSVVAAAQGLGASLSSLLDNTRLGVIQLHRDGRIVEVNDLARDTLRRGDGLFDQGGFLRARLPADNARLEHLLGQALPAYGNPALGGSLTVRRPPGQPRLAVHLRPVLSRQMDLGLRDIAVLVLVVDPAVRPMIAPDLVASALGLTPSQSQVAAMLSEGRSVRDIAAITGRQASTVRYLLKQVYDKQGLTGRADLVRLILSLTELPRS